MDLNHVSRPTSPMHGSASVKRLQSDTQGSARCLLTIVVRNDPACKSVVSGTRVLCGTCRERLLAAHVMHLYFDTVAGSSDGKQVVDVLRNEASEVDVLMRLVRGV